MIIVAIADQAAIDNLARYKELMARLADPRLVKTEEEAEAIIAQAKSNPPYGLRLRSDFGPSLRAGGHCEAS